MQKYGSKRDKALATKGWAVKEGLSVWEAEWVMDVKLFLEGQTRWEADSPYHLMMIHEMFQHTTDQGQKEVEQTVQWGCQQELPKLDPEADISTVQLIGPQTSKEEIQSLYYEVYKLWRLLGSSPGELELMAEVVSSFEDCQGWKWGEAPEMTAKPRSADIWPPRSRMPGRGKKEASVERSLAKVREAHQKALAMAASLEEEIEWLSCPLIRSWPEVQACSRSRDCCVCRSRGQRRRHHQVWPEDCCAPYFEYHPSQRNSESGGEAAATEDPNYEELLELGQEVTCFLRGSAENTEEEDKKAPSPEPPVEELQKWVMWKAEAYEMPIWWRELMKIPGVEDHEKLAWEVWASFWLPKRVDKLHQVENYYQAPPAPLCLLQKNFLPLPNSNFACQDIWEMQCEQTVAYTRALQFWAEKVDPPTGGRPCLLVESVKELREEMRHYLSFLEDDMFKGMALTGETSTILTEEANLQSARTTPASIPKQEATAKTAREPAVEKRPPNRFPGWEKVLHPSWPMVAIGQILPPSRSPRIRPCSSGEGLVWIPQTEEQKVMTTLQEPPTKELDIVQQTMLPPSFLGVMACQCRNQLLEGVCEVPPDPLTAGVM